MVNGIFGKIQKNKKHKIGMYFTPQVFKNLITPLQNSKNKLCTSLLKNKDDFKNI